MIDAEIRQLTPTPATVYDQLHEWIQGQGHDEGSAPWESYVDDPSEVDAADLRTGVCWPIS